MIAFAEYPTSANLRRLLWVRTTLCAALIVLVSLVVYLADLALPVAPLAAIIGGLILFTLLGWLQLRLMERPVRDIEILFQLGVDIAALTALLYFTGGWTNPLVSFLLVPIAAAVAMLSARQASAIAAVAVLCYSLLAYVYQPLAHADHATIGSFTLHVFGMWLTFVFSAGLIAYFGITMAATLRARAQMLATVREANLRNEQIIGVATLAAGTAHELSTPIGSIAVIASELRADATPAQRAELDLLLSQIDVCKNILRELRDTATPSSDDRKTSEPIDVFFNDIRERFQLLRPTVKVAFDLPMDTRPAFIAAEPTLRQAILNLLNNAADVSPESVACTAHWTAHRLILDIRDRGAGFSTATGVAEPFIASQTNVRTPGMGLGLLLANATIERLGGAVHIADRDGGGAWVQVTLPLQRAAHAMS